MIFAPMAASAKPGPAITRIIAVGLAIWIASVALPAFVPSYAVLLAGRTLAGAGEACYAALAPPMIDNTAPSHVRSRYMGIYFSSILIGTAIGFAAQSPFTAWAAGRFVFVVEALLMVPLCLYLVFFGHRFRRVLSSADVAASRVERIVEHLSAGSVASMMGGRAPTAKVSLLQSSALVQSHMGGLSHGQSEQTAVATGTVRLSNAQSEYSAARPVRLSNASEYSAARQWPSVQVVAIERPTGPAASFKAVVTSPLCVCLMLAASAGQFSNGGFSFWAPEYMTTHLHMAKAQGGLMLGGVTAVFGLSGALLGGVLLDVFTERARKKQVCLEFDVQLRCAIAIKMCCVCGFLSVVAAFVGLQVTSSIGFLLSLGVVLGLLCMTQAPVNIALMEAVAPEHRSMAMALNNTVGHLLGDFFSPTVVGAIKDASNLHTALILCACWLIWLPVMYGAGASIMACARRKKTGLVQASA